MPRKASSTAVLDKCYVHAAEHIGFGYEEVRFVLKVQEDASATISRRVKVIAYRKVEKLDHFLLVASSLPLDQDSGVSVTMISSQRANTKITSTEDLSSDRRKRIVKLAIDPPLRRGSVLEYETVEPMSAGKIDVLYNQLDNDRENKFSYDVSWPTKSLTLEVLLPCQYAPVREDADVWRGPSRISVSEVAREAQNTLHVEDAFLDSGSIYYRLTLTIDYPRQGFAYAVKWVPPGAPIDVSPIIEKAEEASGPPSATPGRAMSIYLKRQQAELESRFERLSKSIANLDVDIGRETSFAGRQLLQEKRDELFGERERIVLRMSEIETRLVK